MATLSILLILVGILLSPVQASNLTIQGKPSINLKPQMKLIIYPDGGLRILYNLTGSIKNLITNLTGEIYFNSTWYETNNSSRISSTGNVNLKPLNETEISSLNNTAFNMMLRGTPSKETYSLKGRLYLKTNSTNKEGHELSVINASVIDILLTQSQINATLRIKVSGNKTDYLTYKFNNLLEEYLNGTLKSKGINWIHILLANITRLRNKANFTVKLTLDLNKLIEDEVSEGFLTQNESDSINKCIHYLILNGLSLNAVTNASLLVNKYSSGISGIIGDFDASLDVEGNLTAYRSIGASCSIPLSKFFLSTLQLLQKHGIVRGSGEAGNPQTFPVTLYSVTHSLPKLLKKHPYRAYLLLNASIGSNSVVLTLKIDSGRLKYISNQTGIGTTQPALHELKNWFEDLHKQLAILELAGIPSLLPKEVEVVGASENGKTVNVGVNKVSIDSIDTIPINLSSVNTQRTKTRSPSKLLTITKTLTTSITKTETQTQIKSTQKTITETITSTITHKITQTIEETKPILSTPEGIGLLGAFLATLTIAIILALKKR